MRVDPHVEALRLLADVGGDELHELAKDPFSAIEILYNVPVTTRPPSISTSGCAIDGLYRPGPPAQILVADDVSPARQRFTALHELGHHLIEHDGPLNDLELDNRARRDEDICNEVAASILIPAVAVTEHLPVGAFTARDVAALHQAVHASRAACCVAAARQLRRPGCVILGTGDGVAVFTAHHPATAWRIARQTPQGDDSLLARAGRVPGGHAREVTAARFASGNSSGQLQGDAFADDDGWVFAVLVDDTHSPWTKGISFPTADTGPASETIECPRCSWTGEVYTAPCRSCGDRTCPGCGSCSCPAGPADRVCGNCFQRRPVNQFDGPGSFCVDCR